MAKVLFVGNGINNIDAAQVYTWKDLLRGLIDFAADESGNRAVRKIDLNDEKPFHLLYEEIVAKACSTPLAERRIKEFIAEKACDLPTNAIYKRIGGMQVSHIVTTNYEDLLIKSRGGAGGGENLGAIRESVYGIFRHRAVNSTKIWFIHGYAEAPGSILLGYEQYAGMLQRMRNYVVTGPDYKAFKEDALIKRLGTPDFKLASWIDLFFTADVHFLGFKLDYVEMDIWWLLTYRSRMVSGSLSLNSSCQFRPSNRIVYYIPEDYVAGSEPRLELLKGIGVEVVILKMGADKEAYYRRALAKIEKA